MRKAHWILLAIIAVCFLGAAAWVLPRYLRPTIVARAVAPDGTELRVVQGGPGDAPWMNTAVYVRHPGRPWEWFYYDHEDNPWRYGEATVDAAKHLIVVRCEGDVTATYDYETRDYSLLRPDFPHRVIRGGQATLPPGQSPPGS